MADRRSILLLAVGALTFLLALPGVWARSTYGAQVSVDEPQYLMTALSLAHELDLDVSDEISEGSFRSFHEPDLNTQTTPVDAEGRRFSPHDPLLPALLAPAMRLAPDGPVDGADDDAGPRGWVAARLTTAAIAAITAALTAWVAIARAGVRPMTAAAITVVAFAGVPLGPYATQIYPEMTAALATMAGVAALTAPQRLGTRAVPVTVLAVIALPWLAVKYVPVAAGLGLWLVARLWSGGVRRLVPVATVLAVAGVVYAVIHQRIYGGWTVYASGDHFVETGELSVVGVDPDYAGRSRRLVGLVVDRTFGLAPWQPLWLLAPMALAFLARTERRWQAAVGVFASGYLVATFLALTMHGWWSPGRQVVVVAPIAVVAIAALVDRASHGWRNAAIGAGVIGVTNWLWLAIESSTGRRTIVVDFADTGAPAYRLWSGLFPDGLTDQQTFMLVPWAVILVLSAALGWKHSSWKHSGWWQGGSDGDRGERELGLDLLPEPVDEVDLGLPAEQGRRPSTVR